MDGWRVRNWGRKAQGNKDEGGVEKEALENPSRRLVPGSPLWTRRDNSDSGHLRLLVPESRKVPGPVPRTGFSSAIWAAARQ